MADENASTASPEQPRYVIRPAPNGIFETYANYVDLNWTAHDVRLRICQSMAPSLLMSSGRSPSEYPIEERAGVTMAWAQVKTLRDLLTQAIDQYEKLNGEIRSALVP